MGFGIGPKIPLAVDAGDGVAMIKSFKEMVRDYLEVLILTNPGERVMFSDYGVGLQSLFFEPNQTSLYGQIREKIVVQTGKYMPYIEIDKIDILSSNNSDQVDDNALVIIVGYRIIPLGVTDELVLSERFLSE